MVNVKEDLTGQIFGRLKVLCQADDYVRPTGQRVARWSCECSCEEHKIIKTLGSRLKSGETQSCGCLAKELASRRKHKTNKYDLSKEYGIGWTTNTNREFYFDLGDYDIIKDYCWIERTNNSTGGKYLSAKCNGKHIKMFHLLGFKGYDHENRNPFDNCRKNLRPASYAENSRNATVQHNNTSGFIGVSFDKKSNKWHAYITYDNKRINLGYFINKIDAVVSRLNGELKYFGPHFAPQRHLFDDYNINLTAQN